jgi:hypothetical protein
MLFKNFLRFAVLSTLLLTITGIVAAQGPAIDTNTTTSELVMTATVQTAVQLNISTATGGATVGGSNSTGEFTLEFGELNGLGLASATSANVTVAVDSTGATYSTPITLTPIYTGFTTETADITVEAGESGDEEIAREGSAANSMSSVTTAAPVISNAASESNNTRYVGFRVARNEAAGLKTATFIYTITVE